MDSMSAAINFAVSAIRLILEVTLVVAVLSTAALVTAAVFIAVHEVRKYAHEHDLSRAYLAGAGAGVITYGVKNRVRPSTVAVLAVAGFTALIAIGITDFTSAIASATPTRSGNPPPVLAPLKKSELEMPTEPPARAHRNVAPWPPFTGVRVELGGDG